MFSNYLIVTFCLESWLPSQLSIVHSWSRSRLSMIHLTFSSVLGLRGKVSTVKKAAGVTSVRRGQLKLSQSAMMVTFFFFKKKYFLRKSKKFCIAATKEEWEKHDRNNQVDTEVSREREGEEGPVGGAGIPLQLSENMAKVSCPSAAHEGPCQSRYLHCILWNRMETVWGEKRQGQSVKNWPQPPLLTPWCLWRQRR